MRRIAEQQLSHINDEGVAKILDNGTEHRHRIALCCDVSVSPGGGGQGGAGHDKECVCVCVWGGGGQRSGQRKKVLPSIIHAARSMLHISIPTPAVQAQHEAACKVVRTTNSHQGSHSGSSACLNHQGYHVVTQGYHVFTQGYHVYT